jgi:hypothetical protein
MQAGVVDVHTSCLLSMAQLLTLGDKLMRKEQSKRETNSNDIHLIIITRPQIDHYMLIPCSKRFNKTRTMDEDQFIPVEKHDRTGVIQFIHLQSQPLCQRHYRPILTETYLVEVRNFCNVCEIDNSKVLHFLCY